MIRLIVVFTLFVLTKCFFMDDTCDLLPQGPKHAGHTEDYIVPAECKNGTIAWHYPEGTIIFHFATHRVCFSNARGGEIFKISDVSNINQTHHFPHLIRGSSDEHCTERHKNRVQLRVLAPDTMYIMGMIDYRARA